MAAQAEQAVASELDEEMIWCARAGEVDDMLEQLKLGAEVNARGESGGNTALHMACANGHVAIVQALLARGANINAKNDALNTPAHYCAHQKQVACLRALADHAPKDGPIVDMLSKNEFGKSVLTECIATGDGELASVALEHASATEDAEALAFAEKRVVELGAGCGVGGLGLAAAAPTATVALTDAHPETMDNLRHNVALLLETDAAQATAAVLADADEHVSGKRRVAALSLDWDHCDAWKGPRFDAVVGADLVYSDDVVPALAKALVALMPPKGGAAEFWYAAPATGRGGTALLLQTLTDLGYSHSEVDAPKEYYANPLSSQDADAALLYFPDLPTSRYKLHKF
ncbi:ankyrin repeat-containing domain protein, partial [Pelagophyceae sp. CCMP2097]